MVQRKSLLKSKKGIIRILEAFVSVMIVFTVLLVVISRQPQFEQTAEEELTTIQRHVLDQVTQDPNLRNQILSDDKAGVNDIIGGIVPPGYSYDVAICSLGEACSSDVTAYIEGEVFIEEAVVSANLSEYDPTIIKIFFWEGDYPEVFEPTCGDASCDGGAGEDQTTCPQDCGEPSFCGDNTCNANEDCSSCSADCGSCVANLVATYEITDIVVESGDATKVYYDLTITETSGLADVTLGYRQACFESTGCAAQKYDPVAKFGTDMILAGESVAASGRWFYTVLYPDIMTETWYGTSVGENIDVDFSIGVESSGTAS